MNLKTKRTIDLYVGSFLFVLIKPLVLLLGLVLGRNHHTKVSGDIVFIKMLGGGSLIIAYPALLGIRLKYPAQKMILITTNEVKHFARTMGIFDEIHLIDQSTIWGFFSSIAKVIANNFKSDTLVDLEVHSRFSTLISVFTSARNRIGFFKENSFWRRGIYTHVLFFNLFSEKYDIYDSVAMLLGAQPASWEECEKLMRKSIPESSLIGQYIAVGGSCSETSLERMLNAEQWVRILDRVNPSKMPVYFLGGASDRAMIENMMTTLQGRGYQVSNLCGNLPLEQSVAVIARAQKFLGIDSSLNHYARLLNVDTETFWGPTDPRTLLRPRASLREVVHYRKVSCSPCIHLADTPPCQGHNICIGALFDSKINTICTWYVGPEKEKGKFKVGLLK